MHLSLRPYFEVTQILCKLLASLANASAAIHASANAAYHASQQDVIFVVGMLFTLAFLLVRSKDDGEISRLQCGKSF